MIGLLQDIQLRNPWWLLLALQPAVLWMLGQLRQRWRRDDYADPGLLPWVRSDRHLHDRGYWRRMLLVVLAWWCLAIAMAGPRVLQGTLNPSADNAPVLELVVDLSFSMSARDIQPSRIQRVRLELHDLLARLRHERVGLVVYAARAHVMLPPTTDRRVLAQAIDLLRVRELPTEGSNMYAGLQLARQQLHAFGEQGGAILLLSDGDPGAVASSARRRLSELANGLRDENIHLYTFGVATHQGMALLDPQRGWLQADGRAVVSRLHVSLLQNLAEAGNGNYTGVTDDASDWQAVYDDGIARLQPSSRIAAGEQDAVWRDLSAWFVLPGVMLLLLAGLRLPRQTAPVQLVCIGCAILLAGALQSPPAAAAAPTYTDGLAFYRAGNFDAASRVFAALPGYQARMAEAASFYHQQQYSQAAAGYIQAVLDAGNDTQRGSALFNLGNSYYRQAEYARAADAYRDALHYRPEFAPARINLDYARELARKAGRTQSSVERSGSGYHTAPAAPGTNVGKGRFSIGDSVAQPHSGNPEPDSGKQAENKLSLQLAAPATQDVELDKDPQWTYEIRQARDIRPQDIHFTVDETLVWQRLFEAEEGFPAPREQPETLPGVAPW